MIAVRLISGAELEDRLRPFRCRKVRDIVQGAELWETGWGEPFTVFSIAGKYDEWQYLSIVGSVISETIPADWPEE